MAKDGCSFTLFLKAFDEPNSKRGLAGAACQIAPDDDDRSLNGRLRPQKELVVQLVRNPVECGCDKAERFCKESHW